MSNNAKFYAVTFVVAALAMIVSSPSWAGDQSLQTPPTATGGMGFGPMAPSLLASARLTRPLRGEEPATQDRGEIVLAGRDRLPDASTPKNPPPTTVEQQAQVTLASQQWAEIRN